MPALLTSLKKSGWNQKTPSTREKWLHVHSNKRYVHTSAMYIGTRAFGHFKALLHLNRKSGEMGAVEWRGCSIKGSQLSAWYTVGTNVKERERERDRTGHSCGQRDHFLPAACSGCFCQCYISQDHTAEHRHHCYRWQTGEESMGCVCVHEPKTLDTLSQCGNTYNTHHAMRTIQLDSLFLQTKGHSVLSLEGLCIQ